MKNPFELTLSQLLEIAEHLEDKIVEGLQAPDQEIHAIPTYVPSLNAPKEGRALVVDLGGTNVRAAVASLHNGALQLEKGPVTAAIPVKRGVPLARDAFLESLAELIASLAPDSDLPVGYCFSYPAESIPDGDARLIRWTKEVFVNDTVGERIGSMLLSQLAGYKQPVRCSTVTVINDTVASLLSGPASVQADGYIGLIVGTGTNMAMFMEPDVIPKLPEHLNWKGPLPINLESGNFTPPHLTEWDDQLDARSENPREQRFEKAVSGVYLATLLHIACPESTIDPQSGSKGVVNAAYHSAGSAQKEVECAQHILARSAQLVAASLAGLIHLLNRHHARKTICITAEGGLFWGHPSYKQQAENTLKSLLESMGLGHIAVDIKHISHANLLGSLVAALSHRPQ